MKKIRKILFNFWHYQGWLVFFRPPILFLLIISFILFYFGLIETQKTKVERYKWVVSSALGVRSQDIEYIGDGWLSIPAQRKTLIKDQKEQAKYIFNPLQFLFSSEAGVLTRRGVRPYQYSATHPIIYNSKGDVWINREGSWIHGRIYRREIKWDTPQRVGGGEIKISGHEITTQDKELQIIDK